MCKKNHIALLFLFSVQLFGQDVITTNLMSYTNSIIDNIPTAKGNDDYIQPSENDLTNFAEAISLIMDKDYAQAASKANEFGYNMIKIIDNYETENKNYYMLKTNSDNLWGTFIFAENPKRSKLVIQIAHPKYDRNTGSQGISVYRKTEAYAYFLSGTHRCNSSYYSDCSGTTSACSDGYESYRQSDQAHNVNSTFQKATEVLESKNDSLVYFQFHGFTRGDSDPNIIMSNGSQSAPDGIDYLTLLKEELETIDPQLTYKIAHIDLTYTKLIATTNTQGRLINGSGNPCSQSAPSNCGRFIHLEQSFSELRKYTSDWNKMSTALNNIIPVDNITGIERTKEDRIPEIHLTNYPNPFNASTIINYYLPYDSFVNLIVYNSIGKEVLTLLSNYKSSGEYTVNFDGSNFSSGIYFYKLETKSDITVKKMILLK